MHTHGIGVNAEASLLLAECDELAFTVLDSDEVLLWHKRRLVALVSVMRDHDDGTLTFNPDTNAFAEDSISRVQAMTHAASAADKLFYAAKVRKLPNIIINYGYGRDAEISSSILFQQQVFTSRYGIEKFHNPHPLSASMLHKLIAHNRLPELLDQPETCLCCSLPFKPSQVNPSQVYCTRCAKRSKLRCKAIRKSVVAIQRWWKRQWKSACFAASPDEDSVEYHRAHGPASRASLLPSGITPMAQISISSLAAGSPLNPDAHVFVPSIDTENLEPYTKWSLNNERHGSIVDQSIRAAQPKLDKYFKPSVPRKYAWPRISQDDHPAYSESFKKTAVLSCDHWGGFL